MFRSLFPFRRLLATSFLLVFVNVLAGQCYCATMRQQPVNKSASQLAAKPAPMLPGHACCRAAAAAKAKKAASKQAFSTQKKHSSGSDNCCRNKAASLVATPSDPAAKVLASLAPALLPAAADFAFRPALAGQWDRTAPVRLVSPQHLPPKIPDIRIFIQSLTV